MRDVLTNSKSFGPKALRVAPNGRDHTKPKAASAAKSSGDLAPTASGLNHLNSLEYERYMIGLMTEYYESDEFFYEFLIGVTAALLCELDPNSEEATVFDKFVEENRQLTGSRRKGQNLR